MGWGMSVEGGMVWFRIWWVVCEIWRLCCVGKEMVRRCVCVDCVRKIVG